MNLERYAMSSHLLVLENCINEILASETPLQKTLLWLQTYQEIIVVITKHFFVSTFFFVNNTMFTESEWNRK